MLIVVEWCSSRSRMAVAIIGSPNRPPVAVAFIAGQDNAATLVSRAHQLKEDCGSELVQRQVPHLINYQHLGCEVHSHAPLQPPFPIGAAEIVDHIVRRDEVRAEAGLDGRLRKRHTQVRFAHAGRPQENQIAGIMDESQAPQFANLALINRGLKGEVELLERLHKRQVRQLQARPQIPTAARVNLAAEQFIENSA